MGKEIPLFVDDLIPSSICQCRICHEEEIETSKSIETPCACSGTLKFAHRECIQRWCDEKGNTTCEICLQKFEPGYTTPPKKIRLADVAVTIRGSLEVPRQNHNHRLRVIIPREGGIHESNNGECSYEPERSISCCRSIALIFTILMLGRHLVSVLTGVVDHHGFTVLTVFVLRAAGIVIPLYLIMQAIEAIQRRQRQQQQHEADVSSLESDQEEEQLQHTIQIH
ncbi:uncharacterized protein LOC143851328 [Tasmannia lanceolata]|uniref:uncharacterized protein LOC143851328 n=1 Tax=Tasmannia lanceolata TaxID=3420 RepID=UPI00406464DA